MPRRFRIVESSMSPTLRSGDFVYAVPARRVRRGDIVVFQARPDFAVIKRVIGLGGERVTIENGSVAIDGRALEEPWPVSPITPGVTDILVPSGSVFVLGDARTMSGLDSRSVGPVPIAECRVARWRYWPRPASLSPGSPSRHRSQ